MRVFFIQGEKIMEDLKKELTRVGLDKAHTTESVLQELALEWNDMS
jgi:hypothetical protein